jgi:muramidase (phage lysozyme)
MESEKTSCASSSYSFFKPHAQDETFLQWVTRKEAEEANQQGSHQQDTLMTDPDTDTAILKM